jgi:disulfide bond formation protein DsbB
VASARLPSARLLVVIAVACLAAVGAALVSQHKFDMQPCPWCVLQRLIFVAIALVCLIGAAIPARAGRIGAAVLVDLLAMCGIAAALWQHFKAAASASCNLTLADKIIGALQLDSLLPDVFSPRASCADAALSLFGVPYDFWSLALFVLCSFAAISVMRTRA